VGMEYVIRWSHSDKMSSWRNIPSQFFDNIKA
jgi:hypothetical protein